MHAAAKGGDSSSQLTWVMLVSCEPPLYRIPTYQPPPHSAILDRCLAAATPLIPHMQVHKPFSFPIFFPNILPITGSALEPSHSLSSVF